MRLGLGVRHAHPLEPAQTHYLTHLVDGLRPLLAAAGDELYLYGNGHNREALSPALGLERESGVSFRQSALPIHRQSAGLLWEQTALPVRLRVDGVDVYHGPFNTLPRAARAQRRVVTIHDLAFERNPEHFDRRSLLYARTLTRVSVRHADVVLTVSQATKNDVIELYKVDPRKIHVTPLALPRAFENAVTSDAGKATHASSQGARPYFLYVGVIHPRKNLALLLRALAALPPSLSDFQLVCVGRRALRADEIDTVVTELGLGSRVLFRSGLSTTELVDAYRGATALVMPSFSEGFGCPALEALATNTPVVAADRGSLPEVLGATASYFNPFSVDELASVLERAAFSPVDRAASRPSCREQLSLFSWEKTCRATLDAYHL